MLFFEKVKALVAHTPVLAKDKDRDPVEVDLQVACISVLLEAALSDEHLDETEVEVILNGIEREFGIESATARKLLDETLEHRVPRIDLPVSLQKLADRYDLKQRKMILGLVRQVIEADDLINEFEMTVYGYISEHLGL